MWQSGLAWISAALKDVPLTYGFAGLLVLYAILMLGWLRVGVAKDLAWGSVRAALQLFIVGLVLSYAFTLHQIVWQVLFLLIMAGFAAQTGASRLKGLPRAFIISYIAVITGAAVAMLPMVALGTLKPLPQETLPIGGMMLGNCMNGMVIGLDRFGSDVAKMWEAAEGAFALGAKPRQVAALFRKQAYAAGTVSFRNTMKVVGIVQIPGAAVGMLLAGVSPLKAMAFQLVIMYMLAAAVSTAVAVGLSLGAVLYLRSKPVNMI